MIEVSEDHFERLCDEALDSIPDELLALVDNCLLVIEDRNADEPGLLGLYEGVPLTERDSHYTAVLPDRITIYRLAILDICQTLESVVDEVHITVVHEIAHHFGIDDERLHELGYD